MESLKLIDQADEELYKLTAINELLSLTAIDGVHKDTVDGVFFILRDTICRIREILSELQIMLTKTGS